MQPDVAPSLTTRTQRMRCHATPRPLAPPLARRTHTSAAPRLAERPPQRLHARPRAAPPLDALGTRIVNWPAERHEELLATVKLLEAQGAALQASHLGTLVSRLAAKHPRDALGFLERLQKLGVRPRGPALTGAVKAHVTVGNLDKAMEVLAAADAQDLAALASSGELPAYGALVHGLCRARRVSEALDIVRRLQGALPRSMHSAMTRVYESLMMGAGLTADPRLAWQAYTAMRERDMVLSPSGLTWLVRALLAPTAAEAAPAAEVAAWRQGVRTALNEARVSGRMTVGVWSALLAVRCDASAPLEAAEEAYAELKQWMAGAWRPPGRDEDADALRRAMRHMMRAYALRGQGEGAARAMSDLLNAGLSLHVEDYTVLFELCAHDPALAHSPAAVRLFRAMEKRGHRADAAAWLMLFAALARGPRTEELEAMWRERQQAGAPSPLECVTVVRGLVSGGRWRQAVAELAALQQLAPRDPLLLAERDALSPIGACLAACDGAAASAPAPSPPRLSDVVSAMLRREPRPRLQNADMLLRGLGAEGAADVARALYEHAGRHHRLRPADVLAAAEAQLLCGRVEEARAVLRAALDGGWRPDAAAALLLRVQYAEQRVGEGMPGLEALLPPAPQPPPQLIEFLERTEARSRHRRPPRRDESV